MAVITVKIPVALSLRAGDVLVYDTDSKVLSQARPLVAATIPNATPAPAPVAPAPQPAPATRFLGVAAPVKVEGGTTEHLRALGPAEEVIAPASYANTGGQFDRYRTLDQRDEQQKRGRTQDRRQRVVMNKATIAELRTLLLELVVANPDCTMTQLLDRIVQRNQHFEALTLPALWHHVNDLTDQGMLNKNIEGNGTRGAGVKCLLRATNRGREASTRLATHA